MNHNTSIPFTDSVKAAHANKRLLDFCNKHQLPDFYQGMSQHYFLPLADDLAHKATQTKPLLVGINGCQGSGKSTLAALLTQCLRENYNLSVANLSIDDFYLTKAQRLRLAEKIHPLFSTRGVPGTHDITLLKQLLEQLSSNSGWIHIPRFNKAVDDRVPENTWDPFFTPADIIILEGWCIGVTAQEDSELFIPANDLEANEDAEGLWRNAINLAIQQDYTPIFQLLNEIIVLQAPSFDCVYQWRLAQENKLRQDVGTNSSALMDEKTLRRFIQHYERLSKHMLTVLPTIANTVFMLDHHHQITARHDNN